MTRRRRALAGVARDVRGLTRAGVVRPYEQRDAGKVLDAGFLTYLAAAVSSILTLVYYLLRAGAFDREE